MTFSPLVDKTMVTTKRSSRFGRKIAGMVVHHWAGTNTRGGINTLVRNNNKKSVNYLILNDGTLIGSVPEEYRAWTSGSWTTDSTRITVEVQNSTGAPNWEVSDAAIATLTRLIADVSTRYHFPANRNTVRGHREFAATACPGPYLYPRLGGIIVAASSGTPPVIDHTPSPTAPTKGLKVDGALGPKSIGAGQTLLGTPADGFISRPSTFVRALQSYLKARRYKGRYWRTLAIDGYGLMSNGSHKVGPYHTVAALQRYLKALGYYKASIDGILDAYDSLTIRAYQHAANADQLFR